jgi:ribonuclease Z
VVDGDRWVLVDCGRGATLRAIAAGLDLAQLSAVLLTHHHSDHLSDLATFAIARWAAGSPEPLRVFAPAGPAAGFARRCLDAFDDDCFRSQADPACGRRPRVGVSAFVSSPQLTDVAVADGWRVRTALVDHHPVEPAVGYRIERAGAVVAVSGDTRVCDGVRALAEGADVLVHEALLTARVSPHLLTWNASAVSVGELAAATRPATLVLTHLIPAPVADADDDYLAEVRDGGFTGRTLVARDLLRVRP